MEYTIQQFIDKQLGLLEIERDAEVLESTALQQTLTTKELEKRGLCLSRLRLVGTSTGLGGRLLLKLDYSKSGPLPAHKFSSGDIVSIRPMHTPPSPTPSSTGVVYKTSPARITIAMDGDDDVFNDDAILAIDKLANDISYKRMREGVTQVKVLGGECDGVKQVIFGGKPPSHNPHAMKEFSNNFFSQNLNESQKESIRFCLASNEIALIHGPPGTGKTTTVVEFIRQAVQRGEKVLACGPSNMSVDNMLQMLVLPSNVSPSTPKIRCVRLGHPARVLHELFVHSLAHLSKSTEAAQIAKDVRSDIAAIHTKMKSTKGGEGRAKLRNELRDLNKELRQRENKIVAEILRSTDVVLATTTGAADHHLKHYNEFDWVIIDEAGQGLEAACWIAMQKGKKVLLAGDHCQLPPTIHSVEAAEKGLADTLFARVIRNLGDQVARMLDIQYRMNDKIMTWASQEFYEGKLVAHESVARHLLSDIKTRSDGTDVPLLLRTPMVLVDTSDSGMEESKEAEGESTANEGEAKLVFKHVKGLLDAGVDPKEIGVITPYNAQVNLLRDTLHSLQGVEVSTVDGFQGREKEAIVISMVRSNPPPHSVGFLSDDRRTNVAITRARRHACVVCDARTVSSHDFLKRMVVYFRAYGVCIPALEYMDNEFEELVEESFLSEQAAKDPTLPIPNQDSTVPTVTADKKQRKSKTQKKQEKDDAQAALRKKQGEEREKEWEEDRRKELMELMEGKGKFAVVSKISYPNTLNSYERMTLHALAETMGLEHASTGEGKERELVVSRPKPKEEEEVSEKPGNKKAKQPKKKKEAADPYAEEVDQDDDEQPMKNKSKEHEDMHDDDEGEMEDEVDSEEEESTEVVGGEAKTKKAKKKKNKKKKGKSDTGTSTSSSTTNVNTNMPRGRERKEEDLDQIIEELHLNNTRCRTTDCKNNVIISRFCEFCKYRYCLYHGLPEAHGCGEEARKKARADWLKQGTATVTGQQKAKPMKEWEKNYVHNKLQKKLDESAKARGGKQQEKKKK